MTTLLLPCAGKSSRYPGVRPKWMLTTPDGELAVQQAAKSVEDGRIRRRVIAIRADHENAFGASAAIRRAFGDAIEIVVVDRDTNGPAETVSLMIEAARVEGPIIVKDADSFFAPATMPEGSFVAATDLRHALDVSRVGAKSFVVINEQGLIAGIVEKQVASNFISSGAYAFADAARFTAWLMAIREAIEGEIFVSHVVSEGLRAGEIFRPFFVRDIVDVGTLADWRHYTARRKLLLVDIDGVVFENQSEFFPPYWGEPVVPIAANVEHLRGQQQGGAQLVFVTSRPERYRAATMNALSQSGLVPHALVMGCVHASRVLVNDFAPSNPYPTAVAVNIARNAPELDRFLA